MADRPWIGLLVEEWNGVPAHTEVRVLATSIEHPLVRGVAPDIIYTIERVDGEPLPTWRKTPAPRTTINAKFVSAK